MLLAVLLVNNTSVQNYLAKKGAEMLSKKLKTKVSIDHVRIDFLNHFLVQGVYIEGQAHDTLLYAGEIQLRITDWFIFKDNPTLHYIGLQNTYVHLYRTPLSKNWNYDFIADAFSTGKKDTAAKPFKFDLNKVELEHVRIHMDDHWVGEDLDFDVGKLAASAKGLDFDKELIDVSNITIDSSDVSINEYKGGRPPKARTTPLWEDLAHKTPFNPDKWKVNVKDLSLAGCTFHLTSDNNVPEPGLFDENHLAITNINIAVSSIHVIGDTIRGNIDRLTAQERCGIAIKNMHSKVTVSPNASICENLSLETNYSKVQDYYAMHYKHFPDFLDYIDSVVMVAHVKDAIVDKRDIAYFAPQLNALPNVALHVTGDGKGTVSNLGGQHLMVTDGSSTIKGDVTMKGLPDIYKTYITYSNGELLTTGTGILRYAPSLRNSPNIALERILFAYFKGKYEGYIENFSVNGTLTTNLGVVTTDLKMSIPGFRSAAAVYSGTVAANEVQIGTFLKQPLLGNITLKENFSGNSFNPDNIQLNIDGTINEITIKDYPYQNIITHGTIEKKQFNGTLLVDDPNLELKFDGDLNYAGKNLVINAKANLLHSNFNALKLTTDTITLAAGFDLNCTGNNIDNFFGYAKFKNIALKRNAQSLTLDSILLRSSGDSLNKTLTLQSKDVVATVKGSYELSKLPASVQYYLSRYLPNYIKTPEKFAPNQNFDFKVSTGSIDNILAVTVPFIKGFDSSTFNGSLNTTAKRLTLNAAVPYGSLGTFHMSNIVISGLGDLDMIGLNATIDNVAVGDSFLNGSLSVTTTVAHDSVAFTIATTTPDTTGTITLNGQILARKDSLFLTILPSQFYMNQVKWDIAGGSKVVYSDKYLLVQDFSITSGLQRVTAATELQNNSKSLLINTENLDLSQFGSWAGLSMYQPDGQLNGTIRIYKIFQGLHISANMKATDVLLGTDTVGTINVIGDYDGAKKLISFDPQTGIYHGNSSVTAAGNISFDSNTHQKLDGAIQFYAAPVAWASPFLAGIMSHLSGVANGTINFSGSAYDPQLSGDLTLLNAGMRLDYMGCNYTIPIARVHIDNRRIELGKVTIWDSKKRTALLTGHFSHNFFKNMRMHMTLQSDKFEVMNLTAYDNNLFYGDLVAGVDSVTLRGPFNDIRLNVYNAKPAEKSHIYLPVSSGGEAGTYSYVTFKSYGKVQDKQVRKAHDKFHVNIDANFNTLAEVIIVLDPATGDRITATGNGRVLLDIPPDNDMNISGKFDIESGTYDFTLNQLAIHRSFMLDDGYVYFNGAFSETSLDVNGHYRAKAKLADLLTDAEKTNLGGDLADAQTPQWVDVVLHMKGLLSRPALTFDLDLEDKHSQNTIAYMKLKQINNDPRTQFQQVGSLLLIGQFIPPEGLGSGSAITGAVNNFSQLIASSASTGLTTIVNKLTHDKALNVAVTYTNYNYSDAALGGVNRNQVKVDVNKSYLNDRLLVEVGSTSDWGHPTSTSQTSNFNLTGDFRVQYKITQSSGLRINAFRTSDYDVTLDRDVVRSGVGLSWRKSFDNLDEFFHGKKYAKMQMESDLEKLRRQANDTTRHTPVTE